MPKVGVQILERLQNTQPAFWGDEIKLTSRQKMQKISETINEYKEAMVSAFKDMDVEIKDWNFSVGKVVKQYNVEVTVKLTIKPKKA